MPAILDRVDDEQLIAHAVIELERNRPFLHLAGGWADACDLKKKERESFLRGVLYAIAARSLSDLPTKDDADDVAALFALLMDVISTANLLGPDKAYKALVPSAFKEGAA